MLKDTAIGCYYTFRSSGQKLKLKTKNIFMMSWDHIVLKIHLFFITLSLLYHSSIIFCSLPSLFCMNLKNTYLIGVWKMNIFMSKSMPIAIKSLARTRFQRMEMWQLTKRSTFNNNHQLSLLEDYSTGVSQTWLSGASRKLMAIVICGCLS